MAKRGGTWQTKGYGTRYFAHDSAIRACPRQFGRTWYLPAGVDLDSAEAVQRASFEEAVAAVAESARARARTIQ